MPWGKGFLDWLKGESELKQQRASLCSLTLMQCGPLPRAPAVCASSAMMEFAK